MLSWTCYGRPIHSDGTNVRGWEGGRVKQVFVSWNLVHICVCIVHVYCQYLTMKQGKCNHRKVWKTVKTNSTPENVMEFEKKNLKKRERTWHFSIRWFQIMEFTNCLIDNNKHKMHIVSQSPVAGWFFKQDKCTKCTVTVKVSSDEGWSWKMRVIQSRLACFLFYCILFFFFFFFYCEWWFRIEALVLWQIFAISCHQCS